jgi:hypothetical protein
MADYIRDSGIAPVWGGWSDAIITILLDRNYMENLYSQFLILKQMAAIEGIK